MANIKLTFKALEISYETIRIAQGIVMANGGLRPGQAIAHLNDVITYKVRRVIGDFVLAWVPADCNPTGKMILKAFLLEDVYDINLASEIAAEYERSRRTLH